MNQYIEIQIIGLRKCPQCFGGYSLASPGITQSMADAGYMGEDAPTTSGACTNPNCRGGWVHERLTEEEFDNWRRREREEDDMAVTGGLLKAFKGFLTGKVKPSDIMDESEVAR